jgi:hypothetical protein
MQNWTVPETLQQPPAKHKTPYAAYKAKTATQPVATQPAATQPTMPQGIGYGVPGNPMRRGGV